MKVLVLNAGSGSQKISLYDLGATLPAAPSTPLWAAYADWNEQPGTVLAHLTQGGTTTTRTYTDPDRGVVMSALARELWAGDHPAIAGPEAIDLIGHRVVHGGPNYRQSTFITPAVKEAIAEYEKVAGSHNRNTLQGITLMDHLFPGTPQMAAFDTAFHAHLPLAAAVYPGPYAWFTQGIRRYGFHGLSHQYAAERAAALLGQDPATLRLVTCHLGGGCSLAAVQGGHSINTTMGFTPLEGLMMNNRSGSVDPGVLIFLLRYGGYTVEQLDRTLHEESGLEGISGSANDLRELLAADPAIHPRARLAIDIYVQRLREGIGAMVASLGGLDALVFTGGVGEHLAAIRAEASAPFAFMGLTIDAARNAQA
nr:acetate/propionate family kinase [Ktedonobacterales bacterium]